VRAILGNTVAKIHEFDERVLPAPPDPPAGYPRRPKGRHEVGESVRVPRHEKPRSQPGDEAGQDLGL